MGTTRTLSIRKSPSVLFKIDLAKAFDSVNWIFLLELLSAVGCPLRWTNWISVLLSTASTKVLLNGVLGRCICHGRGLRQGDPLSPMLFVLVMECFSAMIKLADSRGLFSPLRPRSIKQRVSLLCGWCGCLPIHGCARSCYDQSDLGPLPPGFGACYKY
jgi:hypothetical protein